MLVKIYLNSEGQEQFALGQPNNSWHFSVHPVEGYLPSETSILLLEVDLPMPDKVVCALKASEKLKAREKEIQAEAYKEVMAVQERMQKLASLTYEVPISTRALWDNEGE